MSGTEIKQQKQRDISLDIICGVLIIHMILGHLIAFYLEGKFQWFEWEEKILFFFMPWFFFKNGMFFRPTENIKELLKHDYKRLLRPFIIWSIIGELVRFIDVALSEHAGMWQWYAASVKTIFTQGWILGNGVLWFLLSLFLVRIFFNLIVRHKRLVAPMMIISVLIPMLCWRCDLNQAISIPHTIAGLFYFSCGYYLKDWQRNKNVIALSGFLLFTLTLISPSMIEMAGNNLWNGNIYTFGMINAVAAIVLVNNILPPPTTAKIIRWLPFKILAHIGRDSMSYYVTHCVLLSITSIILVRILGVSDPMTIFQWELAACILALPIIVWGLKNHTKLLD